MSDERVYAAVRAGGLVRLHPGQFVDAAEWAAAHPEQREVAFARAAAAAARGDVVFSHATAAAIHGLPLARHRHSRTHVMVGSDSGNEPTARLFRHRDAWDGEVCEIRGLYVTTLSRTVFDVARTESLETALVCADAAFRMVSRGDGRRIDERRLEAFRADVMHLIYRATGRRGVKQARAVMQIADAGADSPGESISRLYLRQIGHEVTTQIALSGPGGVTYYADFDFAGVYGEFDGAVKYVDQALRGTRTADDVLLEEKRREDWIRATTGRRVIRWTSETITSRDSLAAYLRAAGIMPTGRPRAW